MLQNHYNFVSVSVFVFVLVFVFVFVIVFVLFHPWHWMASSSFGRNLLESVCGHVNSVQRNVVVEHLYLYLWFRVVDLSTWCYISSYLGTPGKGVQLQITRKTL